MSASDVMKMIKEKDVKFVDFRFTDTQGKEQHVSVPSHTISEDVLECLTVHLLLAGKASMNQT